jgi:cytoskeletal protein RodZ
MNEILQFATACRHSPGRELVAMPKDIVDEDAIVKIVSEEEYRRALKSGAGASGLRRKKRRSRRGQGGSTAAVVLLVILFAILVLGGSGFAVYWFAIRKPGDSTTASNKDRKDKDSASDGSNASPDASAGGDVTMTVDDYQAAFLTGGFEKAQPALKKYAGHYITVKSKVVGELPGQENTVLLADSRGSELAFPLASRPASKPRVGQQVTLRGKCDPINAVATWELVP